MIAHTNNEAADLLAGIIAHPEDDDRRLVYSDWLEENGDVARAEFIRVQVRLAAGSPADEDYPDLIERKRELDLGSVLKRKASAEDVTRFLTTLSLPQLRHLTLKGWPVDDAGAKAIATNPTFAQLTILDLSDCQIGPKGASALFTSSHLRRLVKLKLSGKSIGNAASALLDPAVMPELCDCTLLMGSEKLKEQLNAARKTLFT